MPQVYCIIPGQYLSQRQGPYYVIKVGKHQWSWLERIRKYGPESKLLIVREVQNENIAEAALLSLFKAHCRIYTGREYFWCSNAIIRLNNK